MYTSFRPCIVILLMLLYVPAASADPIVCPVTADVSIDEWSPDENLNYKDRIILATNLNSHHGIARGLFRFDIPDEVTAEAVTTAALYVSGCSHCGGAAGGTIAIYALTAVFNEDRDTWNTLEGGTWDETVYVTGELPGGNSWNQAVDGMPPEDAVAIEITELLQERLNEIRDFGIMVRFLDEHQIPYTHQNMASRESEDPLDFAPFIEINGRLTQVCPAELVCGNDTALLGSIRRFRAMLTSGVFPPGRNFAGVYRRHSHELLRIYRTDGSLRAETRALLKEAMPDVLKKFQQGAADHALSADDMKRACRIIARIQEFAGPELRYDLNAFRTFFQQRTKD